MSHMEKVIVDCVWLGAALQTRPLLTDLLIDPLWKYLQNTVFPEP